MEAGGQQGQIQGCDNMLNNMGLGLMFTAKDMASGQMSQLENRFSTLDSQISKTQKKFNQGMETFRKGLKTFSVGAGILATVGLAVKSASNLQEAMIGVQKTTGMADNELAKLRKRFQALSMEMPQSATEMAKIGEIAGQLGITGVKNIEAFTTTIAKMTTATNLTAEEASEDMARLANVLKIPIEESERLGSVINEMSNTSTADAKKMVDSMRRMAGAGRTLGLTTDQIAGLSATLTDLGVTTRVGGTAMTQLFTRMTKDVDKFAENMGVSTSQFKEQINNNAIGAIEMMLEHMQGLDKFQRTKFLENVGINSSRMVDALLKMADGSDTLEKHLKTANEAWQAGTSLNKEYENALRGITSQVEILRNIFDVFIKRIGYSVMPLATGIVKIFQTLGKVLNMIPQPVLEVLTVMATLTGIVLTLGGAWMMAHGALTALIAFMAGQGILATATFGALLSQVLLPITLIAGALVALRYAWKYNFLGIRDFVTKWWDKISLIFEGLQGLFDPESYGQLGEGLRDRLKEAGLLDFVVSIYTTVNDLQEAWEKWGGTVTTLLKLAGAVWMIYQGIKMWQMAQAVLNGLMMANPIGLLLGGIALLITGTYLLIKNWDKVSEVIMNVWDSLWEFVNKGLVTAYNWIVDILEKVPDFALPKSLENLKKIQVESEGEEPPGKPKTKPDPGEQPITGASIMKEKEMYRKEVEKTKEIQKTQPQSTGQPKQPQPVVLQMDGKEVGRAVINYQDEEEELKQEDY